MRSPPLRLIIPSFDHFVLPHTWPSTSCKIRDNSIDIVSIKYLIHGMWPSNSNSPDVRDCDPERTIDTNINQVSYTIINQVSYTTTTNKITNSHV